MMLTNSACSRPPLPPLLPPCYCCHCCCGVQVTVVLPGGGEVQLLAPIDYRFTGKDLMRMALQQQPSEQEQQPEQEQDAAADDEVIEDSRAARRLPL